MPCFSLLSYRVRIVAGLLALVAVGGCGFDTYENRLKETKDYYTYLEKVDANLAPVWSDPRGIVKIRVPKQFVAIPAPPPPVKNEDGTEAPMEADPRQPNFVSIEIPELVGAWEAPVEVSTPEGERETRQAYIYAVSNYWVFIGENANDAPNFTKSLTEMIGASLDETATEEPPELHPKPGGYLPSASYNVFRFKPKAITLPINERQVSVNYTFEIYERQNGDIQCPLIVVLPENIDSREKINERIPLMLDYLELTKTPPRPGSDKAAPVGNGPVGGGF